MKKVKTMLALNCHCQIHCLEDCTHPFLTLEQPLQRGLSSKVPEQGAGKVQGQQLVQPSVQNTRQPMRMRQGKDKGRESKAGITPGWSCLETEPATKGLWPGQGWGTAGDQPWCRPV